jgi:acetyltransferase
MRDDIPVFSSLEETLKAYYYSERYRYKLTKLMAIPPLFDDAAPVHKGRARQLVAPFLKTEPSPLPETVARDLLGIYGIHGTTVSTVAEDPVGLTLNSSWDPEFGPFIALGLGGSCARFNPDIAIMLPPLNPLLARRMIDKSPAGPILKTYPLEKLIELLLRFSTLLCDFAELRQAGIELQCDRQGNLRLTRAALEVATSSIEPPRHLVIMPYPSQYQFHETLANGTRVLIRPIKPEDEEKHFAFFHSLSRQTNYYRFFSYRKKLTHEQITRFTQIDYDREMAIIALVEENGKEKTIGVNRLVYYPRDDRYEFALVVTDDWQDKGVGKVLMEKLISIARDRGIKTIYGNILAENNRMIQFCRRFGFKEYQSEGEVVLVKLEL